MRLIVFIIMTSFSGLIQGQGCCSGSSANPIAGGASTGVLFKNQVELSGSYQYSYSDIYFSGDSDTLNMIDGLVSKYLFFRADYGITDKLTMSVAAGYYPSKTLIELGLRDTITSSGMSDLILFPRYSIYNKTKERSRSEITLGLGVKIPLGSNIDSNFVGKNPNGGDIYAISPPTVQVTTGSKDLMFYSFFYQGYPKRKLRFFANTLFIRKGFNSIGQKFGDYATIGLFVSKTIMKNVGLTAQMKMEWIGKTKVGESVSNNDLAIYSIDLRSSGSRKIFFVPQLSYSYKSLTLFATSDIPLYQYLNGVQVGSMIHITTGLSYRFLTKKENVTPATIIEVVPSSQ